MSDKPKCPVFGCNIPRGIPHSHPAGVSSVMRDPYAPLTLDERAELETFRRERIWMTQEGLKAFSDSASYCSGFTLGGKHVEPSDVYLDPADELHSGLSFMSLDEFTRQRQMRQEMEAAERRALMQPRMTFVKIVGRICLMVAIAFGLSSALVLIAMSAGWL